MKISLIILQTLDGFIADGEDDNLSWGSTEDKNFFRTLTKQIGVMIMGSSTFQNMPDKAFSNRYSLVLTSKPEQYSDYHNEYGEVEFFKGTPQEAVTHLEGIGYHEAAVIGGGRTNGQFLEAGLVDELYITIAPYVFGSGIKGFADVEQKVRLELLEHKLLTPQEVLLHYKAVSKNS